MNLIQQIIQFVNSLLTWWFTVDPWEQAIRVRCGKHVRLFGAGLYWKFPFFDSVYKQNVRRRVSSIPIQTLTTKDRKSLTVYGSIGYKVLDVLKLHMTLHDAEHSVQQEVLGLVTDYIVQHELIACTPNLITERVKARMNLGKYGLGDVEFFLIGYVADVPTYRLLQDSIQAYNSGGNLSTAPVPGVLHA